MKTLIKLCVWILIPALLFSSCGLLSLRRRTESEVPETAETGRQTEIGESRNASFYASEASLKDAVKVDSHHFGVSKRNDNADRRLFKGPCTGTPVTADEEAYRVFSGKVASLEVVYTYEDDYHIEEAFAKEASYRSGREEQAEILASLQTGKGEIPSAEKIGETVRMNNEAWLPSHPGYYELDGEEIDLMAGLIRDMLRAYRDKLTDVDYKRIMSLLSDIRIVGIDSYDFTLNELRKPYNARVLEDGTIIVDLDTIRKYLPQADAREKTYEHEIYHLFQRMCPMAQIPDYTQIGPSQYFEDLEINSLHWNWLYEAAAEKLTMNRRKAENPLVYKNMIGYLKSLDLALLPGEGKGCRTVEEATLTVDPEGFLGLLAPLSKEEAVKLLYSIDYLQNNRDDLEKLLMPEGFDAEKRTAVKIDMKNGICLSLSRIFYQNLAEAVRNGSATLEDVFYLINVWEEDLSYHTGYDERSEAFRPLLEGYVELQDAFFEMLSVEGERDIPSEFLSFALAAEDGEIRRNCSLTFLTEEDREFVFEEMLTYNISDLTVNVRTAAASLA